MNNQNGQNSQNSRNNENNQKIIPINQANQRNPNQDKAVQARNPANQNKINNLNRQRPSVKSNQSNQFNQPGRSGQINQKIQMPRNPGNSNDLSNLNNSNHSNAVKDAQMAEEFQRDRTRIFDTFSNEKAFNNPREDDGSYHYTGRNIQSNRQRLVDVSQNAGKSNKSYQSQSQSSQSSRSSRAQSGRNSNSRISRDTDDNLTVSNKRDSRNKNKNIAEAKSGGFIMSGIIKAVLYIVGVILVSVIIAYNAILIANDVFAFVKDSFSVEVTIPENADIKTISKILYESKLIKYPDIFNLYVNYREKDNAWEFAPGIYTVSSTMGYDELASEFRVKTVQNLEVVRITIPEGWTIDQIIDEFLSKGMGSREKFVAVINENKFDYKFTKMLDEVELSPDRKYKLEGYIFPDTYEFYKTESELSIIKKFLNNFDLKFTEDFYKRCETLDMTVDEIITLASMIQKEARFPEDFNRISAVFHNRLVYSATYPYLQSDATIMYSYGKAKADLTQEDLKEDLPYNTYTRPGLPPSAICNPGYDAIYDALYPDPDYNGKYFFFVSKKDGTTLYGENAAQHEANKIEAAKDIPTE